MRKVSPRTVSLVALMALTAAPAAAKPSHPGTCTPCSKGTTTCVVTTQTTQTHLMDSWERPATSSATTATRSSRSGATRCSRARRGTEDDARAVEARLRNDGFEVTLVRERLAGEDDDEDHPWAILTDAPSIVLELLVDEYDGWLDEDDLDKLDHRTPMDERPAAPLDLPTAPKRIKRPEAR